MSKLEECILGDLVEFQRGYDLPKSKFVEGKYPVQSSNGILGYHNEYKVEGPGITIGRSGTVGTPHLIRENFFPHNTSLFVKEFKGNDIEYIYYLLQYLDLGNQKSGSGVPTMNRNHLHPIKIRAYRDKTYQQRTIKILSLIDKKIQINNQINQELEAMAKTLYDYWFVQFDFPDQNGKPYKSSGGKMVYNPELKREIPEGWGVEKLGNITICHDSKRVPLSSHEREHVKGEIPYYGATGIMDYVNDYIFDGDYVLMAEDGSVMTEKGTPILQRISGKNWVNNHAHVIEPVKNHSCKLLMMLLKDVSVMKIKTGSIQMKINQENMNKIVVPAIPLELLFEINQRLEVIDKQQLNLIEENKQLTQLRDWLLPMLMNGQVKVEDKT